MLAKEIEAARYEAILEPGDYSLLVTKKGYKEFS